MSKKSKIIVAVVVVAVVLVVGISVITWYSLSNFYYYRGNGTVSASYEEIKLVFGDDAMYVDQGYLDSIGFELQSSEVQFSGRTKSIPEGIKGYDKKAKIYIMEYERECSLDEATIYKLDIKFDKTPIEPSQLGANSEKYADCAYDIVAKDNFIMLRVVKNKRLIEVQGYLTQGTEPIVPNLTDFAHDIIDNIA